MVRNNEIVVEGMKFKKMDPKLQTITSAKTVKTPAVDPPSAKQKGIMIYDDQADPSDRSSFLDKWIEAYFSDPLRPKDHPIEPPIGGFTPF